MNTIINSSINELDFYDFDKIKRGKFHRLDETCLTFCLLETEKVCEWRFREDNNSVDFDHSLITKVSDFLNKKGIPFFDITGSFDVELNFEDFYNSKYQKIITNCESIDLFHDTLNYTYFNRYCSIEFPVEEFIRFKNFLIVNSIKFRDLSYNEKIYY